MIFGITMPTYYRPDGSSYMLVSYAIKSLLKQKYQNWKLYFIGDRYEDDGEFRKLAAMVPSSKIFAINLPVAVERDTGLTGRALARAGGANAANVALAEQRKDGINITCELDDDDIWLPSHLRHLHSAYTNYPESVFVCTQAQFYILDKTNGKLQLTGKRGVKRPNSVLPLAYNNLIPCQRAIVHSAMSWNLNYIPFNYTASTVISGDAYMLNRIGELCVAKGYKTLYVAKTTVMHTEYEHNW